MSAILKNLSIPENNWWDKLGKPQYGGELVIRAGGNIVNFDPYFSEKQTSIYGAGWKGWSLMIGRWTPQYGIIGYRGIP